MWAEQTALFYEALFWKLWLLICFRERERERETDRLHDSFVLCIYLFVLKCTLVNARRACLFVSGFYTWNKRKIFSSSSTTFVSLSSSSHSPSLPTSLRLLFSPFPSHTLLHFSSYFIFVFFSSSHPSPPPFLMLLHIRLLVFLLFLFVLLFLLLTSSSSSLSLLYHTLQVTVLPLPPFLCIKTAHSNAVSSKSNSFPLISITCTFYLTRSPYRS